MNACTKVIRIVRDRDVVVNHAAFDIPVLNDSQHLGGMVFLDEYMNNFEVCSYSYREFNQFVGTKCEMTKTKIKLQDIKYHSYLPSHGELSTKCK